MAIPNAEYWARRMEITNAAMLDHGYAYMQNLEGQFDRALASLEKDISAWYQRFADNNAITYTEARKWLTADELKEFRWSVEEYIKRAEENAVDGRWIKELENASARVHISRLDALKLQIQQQAELLHGGQLDSLDTLMRRVYTEGYYTTAYELQRGIGTGWTLHRLNADTVSRVLEKPWTLDGQTFSDRIWSNKQALINNANTHLTQMIIRGDGPQGAVAALARDMRVSKHNAGRLIMTENAYFAAAAQRDCFNELGVEHYVIVATLDSSTSDVCRDMDGKVFKMSEYVEGLTAPPFHPWCRSVTAPYFEDMAGLGERARRDPDTGKTVTDVPRSMKYAEWKEKFVPPVATYKEGGLTTDNNGDIINTPATAPAERLAASLHSVEDAKRELDYEVGTLLSKDGEVLKVYGGSEHQVSVPDSDKALFEGSVFTHNHPGGRTFTLEDIMEFADANLHEVRASTPQGTFFSLRVHGDEVNRSIGRVMKEEKVGSYLAAATELQQEMIKTGEKLTGYEYQQRLFDSMDRAVDNWLTENAEEFGFIYTKGAI